MQEMIKADPWNMPDGLIAFYAELESANGLIYHTQPIAARSISEAVVSAQKWADTQTDNYTVRAVFQHGYGEVEI